MSSRAFTADDRHAVEAVLEEQREAWNRGDLAAFMDGYARGPELVLTGGGEIRRGFDEVAARYQQRYRGDPTGMGRLDFELLGVQAVGADGAVVLGRWRVSDAPAAGRGVFSVVLERRAEGWRIVHDHTWAEPGA